MADPSIVRASNTLIKSLVLAIGIAAGAVLAVAPSSAFAAPRHRAVSRAAILNGTVFNRINAIRVSFGLARGQLTTEYNREVATGVQSNNDPPFAPVGVSVVGEESLWGMLPGSSFANPSPLTVVNAWVYHDGWQGSLQNTWNLDCTSPTASGCNGHRRAVLSTPPVPGAKLYIDVATANVRSSGTPALAIATLMVWKLPAITAKVSKS